MAPIFLLQLYALTKVVFLAVDLLWLGVLARGFYQTHLGPLLAPAVNWPAALVFRSTATIPSTRQRFTAGTGQRPRA